MPDLRADCRIYSTLVVCFAEGVHRMTIAAPPIRPWYPHK